MTVYLIKMFGVSLLLTLLVELPVAYFFGLRARESILLAVLVNILTNPPAVFVCWMGRMYWKGQMNLVLEFAAEALVFIVEAYLYRSFSNVKGSGIRHPILLAAAANLCSWMTGRWISGF